jgi:hypothetical protein
MKIISGTWAIASSVKPKQTLGSIISGMAGLEGAARQQQGEVEGNTQDPASGLWNSRHWPLVRESQTSRSSFTGRDGELNNWYPVSFRELLMESQRRAQHGLFPCPLLVTLNWSGKSQPAVLPALCGSYGLSWLHRAIVLSAEGDSCESFEIALVSIVF